VVIQTASRQRSMSALLTLAWVIVIVYASMFPFSGWRWPAGANAWSLLRLPWPQWHDRFDLFANLAAYVPLGALLAVRRGDASSLSTIGWVTLAASALSYAMEVIQFTLPQRVPSMVDWSLNTAGACAGAWLGVGLRSARLMQRIDQARDRWFERHGPAGLALLALWPLGLLFPTPVPLGLGQIWERLRDHLADALSGVPWAEGLIVGLSPGTVVVPPLAPLTELLAVGLGLLGPCMAAYCITLSARRRLVLSAGAALLALGVTTLSTALNFGPQHALAWSTPIALGGIGSGLVMAWALVGCGRRVAAGIGLVAITASVALIAQAPADPYFAESLSGWEQGRFIRFHGLAQWIGWCWPYLTLAWLLSRIGAREA
jgi:VanZ family protein